MHIPENVKHCESPGRAGGLPNCQLFGTDGISDFAYVDPMIGEMAMQSMVEGEDETKPHRFPKEIVEWVKKRIRK